MSLDQFLKVVWVLSQSLFDLVERFLKCKKFERIVVIQPGSQHAQHDREPARESASIVFAQVEFKCVHGCGDCVCCNSITGKFFKGVEDQPFDLFSVPGARTLESR